MNHFFSGFFRWLEASPLSLFAPVLKKNISRAMENRRHGSMDKWLEALRSLPEIRVQSACFDRDTPTLTSAKPLEPGEKKALELCLKAFCPWRKGPFNFFSVFIDTEWRSDWKWQRVSPHLSKLEGRLVLDVGCGSGYHLWRILGSGASRVVGIDPSILFMMQFQAFKRYAGNHLPIDVLPLSMEEFPQGSEAFDTVFSMGVLYHRKSPLEHIESLFHTLRPGGELVLETLVTEGDAQTVFMPENRYAMMRNVWFIPSTAQLLLWLKRTGFRNCRTVDINQTSLSEQRTTKWMPNHSLKEFLDPENINRTVEGYPAPIRAVVIATK